jgi:hypothetical protein
MPIHQQELHKQFVQHQVDNHVQYSFHNINDLVVDVVVCQNKSIDLTLRYRVAHDNKLAFMLVQVIDHVNISQFIIQTNPVLLEISQVYF